MTAIKVKKERGNVKRRGKEKKLKGNNWKKKSKRIDRGTN